jgi:hypothetical protein
MCGARAPASAVVVQVPGDPVAVLENRDLFRVLAALGQFHRDRGLCGEALQLLGSSPEKTGAPVLRATSTTPRTPPSLVPMGTATAGPSPWKRGDRRGSGEGKAHQPSGQG